MDDDIMVLAYCAECGDVITSDGEAYIDDDGLYFDSVECVLEYHNIRKVEF